MTAMNRQVEDFSAELTVPEIFRELCSVLVGLSRTCILYANRPQIDDEQDFDEDEMVIYTVGPQASLMVWIHLSASTMFSKFKLTRSDRIELPADSLAHAFRSDSGLMAMNEILIKISHRSGRPRGRSASSTANMRLMSVKMYHKTMDGLITKAVEQRVYGEAIDPATALTEPVFDGIFVWVDPSHSQLNQMAKVSNQYRQMNEKVVVKVRSTGEFTLTVQAIDVCATSRWKVELAQRADEEEDNHHLEDETSGCCVLARDWYSVMQARKLFRRIVMGVLDSKALVVYGFLKQGQSQSTTDAVNFYLTHQG